MISEQLHHFKPMIVSVTSDLSKVASSGGWLPMCDPMAMSLEARLIRGRKLSMEKHSLAAVVRTPGDTSKQLSIATQKRDDVCGLKTISSRDHPL